VRRETKVVIAQIEQESQRAKEAGKGKQEYFLFDATSIFRPATPQQARSMDASPSAQKR
jgi:hypothetical protein